jgi:hypothetical protein
MSRWIPAVHFKVEVGAGLAWLYVRCGRRDWYFGPNRSY